MSKLKVVRNIKGTKISKENNVLKELNIIGKYDEEKYEKKNEIYNYQSETSNNPMTNFNLNKIQTNPRTISRGKIKSKYVSVVSPIENKINLTKNIRINKFCSNQSKEINNSVTKDNQNTNPNLSEFNELRILWKELGVTETFKLYFENLACELEPSLRKDYVEFEITNMKKLKEQIQKIIKEIQAREKTILLLYKFDKILNKNEMDKKIKEDIIQTIKNLRILSMNIVNHYIRIREGTSTHIMNGKFELDFLNKLVTFDKNYILKMKNDTDFLYSSSIKKYFDFAPEFDPFLISISNPNQSEKNYDNGNNKEEIEKIIVNIPEDIIDIIKNCQFSILQELIYNEIGCSAINKNDLTTNTGKSSISVKSIKNFNKPVIGHQINHNVLNRNLFTSHAPIIFNEKNQNELGNLNYSKSNSNTKTIRKNNLRPINDNSNNNINNLILNNNNQVNLNYYNSNMTSNEYLLNSKTPDGKYLHSIGNNNLNNIQNMNYNSNNLNSTSKKILNINFNQNNKVIINKSGKLDNGITSYEKDGSFIIDHGINQNLNHFDIKNIDSLLNDSKLTKKTDISNINIKDNIKQNSVERNINNIFINEENESKRTSEKQAYININSNEKINLTDVSQISHKNTPNNKVIIKEKIFIEGKKIDQNINLLGTEETDETGRITKENITKVSLELERLRADVLENHYISQMEKINKQNSHDANFSNKNKEKTNLINHPNNQSEKNLRIGSAKKGKLPNIPTSGKTKIRQIEKNTNNNYVENTKEKEELINNLDKSLIQKRKRGDSVNRILSGKLPKNHIDNRSDISKNNINSDKNNDADDSNLKSTEKSIIENIENIKKNKINEFKGAQKDIYESYSVKIDKNMVILNHTTVDQKENIENFENLKESQEKKLENEGINNLNLNQDKINDKILTHKLMKKIDYALMSSDEFSIRGDRLGNSILSNRLSNRYENILDLEKYKSNKNIVENYLNKDHIVKKPSEEDIIQENFQNLKDENPMLEKIIYNIDEQQNKNDIIKDEKINDKNENKIEIDVDSQQDIIQICDYNNNQLKKIYSDYIKNVDSEQKIIFSIKEEYDFYLQGGFPKFIEIKNEKENKISSFATCYYDMNFSCGLRLVISSFSSIDTENYFKNAEKLISFVKMNFPHNEIYIELFYGYQNEKFYVNEKLRDVFSKQLKFKWITLENTGTQRIVKYRLLNIEFNLEQIFNSKKTEKDSHKLQKILLSENVNNFIDIKINTTMSFKTNIIGDEEVDNLIAISSPREFSKEETDVNIFPSIFLLSELINKNSYLVNNENLKLFSNERTRKIARKFIHSTNGTKEEIEKYLHENFHYSNLPDSMKIEKELNTALIYITNRFKNIFTFEYEGFIYNKLQFEQLEILNDPDTSCKYYLLRTTDENYSILIGEVNKKNEYILDDNINRCENFYKLYSTLDQIQSNEVKTIYLPSFKYEKNMMIENPKFLSDVKLIENKNNYYDENNEDEDCTTKELSINKFFQSFDIQIGHDNEYTKLLNFYPNDSDIVIKNDFIFALINLEVLTDLNIPSISFNLITKNDWKTI